MSKVHPTLPAVTPQGDPLDALAASLRGAAGLLADRTYHMRKYRQCFVGSEAVDWILENAERCGGERRAAVALGNRLLQFGHIRHVTEEHEFEDAPLFYEFVNGREGGDVTNADQTTELSSNASSRTLPCFGQAWSAGRALPV